MSYQHQNKPKELISFLKMLVFIVVLLVVLFLEG
jgi:hypothetical protein